MMPPVNAASCFHGNDGEKLDFVSDIRTLPRVNDEKLFKSRAAEAFHFLVLNKTGLIKSLDE